MCIYSPDRNRIGSGCLKRLWEKWWVLANAIDTFLNLKSSKATYICFMYILKSFSQYTKLNQIKIKSKKKKEWKEKKTRSRAFCPSFYQIIILFFPPVIFGHFKCPNPDIINSELHALVTQGIYSRPFALPPLFQTQHCFY